jgi:carboxyl-terminal processing protease
MPRRNLYCLIALTIFSLLCIAKITPYGRVIAFAMDQMSQRALEKVDEQALFEGALEGMASRLDEYSDYVSPQVLRDFEESIDQKFVGVGVEILLDPATKQLTVASPLVGSPAYEAGIRAGDRILRIDGKSTQGLALEDASKRMRGEPDTQVKLTVLHQGDTDPVELDIVRREIHVDTVLGDTRNSNGSWNFFLNGWDRLGYVRINSFSETTEEELRKAVEELLRRKMRGVVLDLRNNPGGLLSSGIGVADLFVDPTDSNPAEIVSTRDREGNIREVHYATRDPKLGNDFPLVVMVNQLSASASEIVSACLQDNHRAKVVGQRSHGKGTVQELIDLEPGQGVLKLTTSSFWRPSGKNIHRTKSSQDSDQWGVSPDPGYEVKVEGKELGRLLRWRQRRDLSKPNGPAPSEKDDSDAGYFDPQLAKAIECLEKEIKSGQEIKSPGAGQGHRGEGRSRGAGTAPTS